MDSEVNEETRTTISNAARTMLNIGLRKLKDQHFAGHPLSSEEVFALLQHPRLAEVSTQLEQKRGHELFEQARQGHIHDLTMALIEDRAAIAAKAVEVTPRL